MGRNHSPDLDELETAQAQLESQLPPIAVRLQQIQNRLNSIAEQLSTNALDKFQQRIRLMVEDFNSCTKIVRAKRKALEERFADQTHLNQQLEDLEFWCDETEALVVSTFHPKGNYFLYFWLKLNLKFAKFMLTKMFQYLKFFKKLLYFGC